MKYEKGRPHPFGAEFTDTLCNIAVYSEHATEGFVHLYSPGSQTPLETLPLFQTGPVWHIAFDPDTLPLEYTLSFNGPTDPKHLFNVTKELLDPYAKALNTPNTWGAHQKPLRGKIEHLPFDWEGVKKPQTPLEDTIIYECHLRGMTKTRGGDSHYREMIATIPYLKEMGVTAVEFLPLYEFNERSHKDNGAPDPLFNFWGYSTVSFFAPMQRFADNDAITEMKEMVKAFHQAGIEVYLDVVYNHTNEGDSKSYYESMRGIDNATYYIVDDTGNYYNYSGCGNTVRCNHPYTRSFIVDSLAYWADTFQIDGFRFDLASILTRDVDGTPLEAPPLIDMIESHPSLQDVKLIAEAWDCGGLYQVGRFPGKRFSEWNGVYRDTVRRYINGIDCNNEALFRAFSGSQEMYETSTRSINFITAHDGFTLHDLTAYQEKHNEANREGNADGHKENESWNCGVEGETDDAKIKALRKKQQNNFLATLFFSKGIPMVWMGDEYGHTRYGNNNAWCHDNELNYFDWTRQENTLIAKLVSLRKDVVTNRYTALPSEGFGCDMETHVFYLNPYKTPLACSHGGTIVFSTDTIETEGDTHILPPNSCLLLKKR